MWLRAIAPIYSTYSVHDPFSGNKEKEPRKRRPYLYENVISLVFRKQSFLKLCIYHFSFLQEIFLDVATKRKMLSHIVICPNEGCDWTGELRKIDVSCPSQQTVSEVTKYFTVIGRRSKCLFEYFLLRLLGTSQPFP